MVSNKKTIERVTAHNDRLNHTVFLQLHFEVWEDYLICFNVDELAKYVNRQRMCRRVEQGEPATADVLCDQTNRCKINVSDLDGATGENFNLGIKHILHSA